MALELIKIGKFTKKEFTKKYISNKGNSNNVNDFSSYIKRKTIYGVIAKFHFIH